MDPISTNNRGYLAFPDFHTAVLWYDLFGIKSPPPPPTGGEQDGPRDENDSEEPNEETPDEQTQSEDEDDRSKREPATSGGDDSDQERDANPDSEPTRDAEGDEDYENSNPDKFEFELSEPTDDSPRLPGHWTETIDKTEVTHRDFTSWYDFVTCVRDTPTAWPADDRQSHTGSKKFTETTSFREAIKLALEGWPDGLKMLHDLSTLVIPQPQVTEMWDFDVAGAYPLVPMYCAGDPACMVTEIHQEHRAARPIVRIDYGMDAPAIISAKSIMLRGAAVLSLAHTLERLGYSTELRIVGQSRAGDQLFSYSIVFKSAGEPLDLDRAAFAIGHPSTLRRLAFALLEQHAELYDQFEGHYGRPTFEPVDKNPSAIYIPAPRGVETIDSRLRAVEDAALAAGFGDLLSAQKQAA